MYNCKFQLSQSNVGISIPQSEQKQNNNQVDFSHSLSIQKSDNTIQHCFQSDLSEQMISSPLNIANGLSNLHQQITDTSRSCYMPCLNQPAAMTSFESDTSIYDARETTKILKDLELLSAQQSLNATCWNSHDGYFSWKITKVQDKISMNSRC